jgi:predicted ATP-binding protein involved in virulence
MRLKSVRAEHFRAIRSMTVPLDPELTVLHGNNAHGKTSLLAAIAAGLGIIPTFLARSGGISFRQSDRRAAEDEPRIRIETLGEPCGLWWERGARGTGAFVRSNASSVTEAKSLRDYFGRLAEAVENDPNTTIPVFAFYDTDRAVFDVPERKRNFRHEFHRFDAYIDALARKTSFKAMVEWFYAQENIELRRQREQASFSFRLPRLDAVRNVITKMMPDVSDPHIEPPAQFVVRRRTVYGETEKLSLDQLSGGYRIVLALAADLVHRMSLANPHLPDPRQCEAIVLIDEVELHLHPEWQQRILGDFRRTFPNTQFIVSTHSPQVLTTVEPRHIVHLRAASEGIVAEHETGPTFGAKAGDVLEAVMGVEQRPSNEFSRKLSDDRRLIATDQDGSDQAKALRLQLMALSPDDPALAAADVEIGRRRVMRELAARR